MRKADELKESAALNALDLVQDGMLLGLGTGSTAARFVDALGAKVAKGLKVLCVPTSEATRIQAERLGIPLTTLDETPKLHLTIDGADEIDERLRLIKGGGGALLREKIVATASDRMVVIADESKLVAALGHFPLPIEVVRFGFTSSLGAPTHSPPIRHWSLSKEGSLSCMRRSLRRRLSGRKARVRE